MPELGRKYTCYSCHTKFYDLGKPEPICPKCGADQRDAEEAPATVEDEFAPEGEAAPASTEAEEEEDIIPEPEREEEPEEEEEEEEY